jgi:hypothetical protein
MNGKKSKIAAKLAISAFIKIIFLISAANFFAYPNYWKEICFVNKILFYLNHNDTRIDSLEPNCCRKCVRKHIPVRVYKNILACQRFSEIFMSLLYDDFLIFMLQYFFGL